MSRGCDGSILTRWFSAMKAARMSTPLKPLKPADMGVTLYYKHEAPETDVSARRWVEEAIRTGCYLPTSHAIQRLAERDLTMADLLCVIKRPSRVEPYSGMSQHGGTCWRFIGRGLDTQSKIAVGVELYLDEQQRWAILCTIFPEKGAKGRP